MLGKRQIHGHLLRILEHVLRGGEKQIDAQPDAGGRLRGKGRPRPGGSRSAASRKPEFPGRLLHGPAERSAARVGRVVDFGQAGLQRFPVGSAAEAQLLQDGFQRTGLPLLLHHAVHRGRQERVLQLLRTGGGQHLAQRAVGAQHVGAVIERHHRVFQDGIPPYFQAFPGLFQRVAAGRLFAQNFQQNLLVQLLTAVKDQAARVGEEQIRVRRLPEALLLVHGRIEPAVQHLQRQIAPQSGILGQEIRQKDLVGRRVLLLQHLVLQYLGRGSRFSPCRKAACQQADREKKGCRPQPALPALFSLPVPHLSPPVRPFSSAQNTRG